MADQDPLHWRPLSVAIILALFVALFALSQFHLLQVAPSTSMGCVLLFLAMGWNLYVMKRSRDRQPPGSHPSIADGFLVLGLLSVFIGAFF